MKILLLQPQTFSEDSLVEALRSRGITVLVTQEPLQAWQVLKFHGRSVELAIVHREGANGTGEPGFEFLTSCRGDPSQADLPIVLSSSKWNDKDFIAHQNSEMGVNAYIKWPPTPDQAIKLLEEIFSESLGALAAPDADMVPAPIEEPRPLKSLSVPAPPVEEPLPDFEASMILEDAGSLFSSGPASPPSMEGGIRLEAPELPADQMFPFGGGAQNQQAVEEKPKTPEMPSFLGDLSADEVIEQTSAQAALPAQAPTGLSADDILIAKEMPYLLGRRKVPAAPAEAQSEQGDTSFEYPQSVGNAVIPGGAAHSPDNETIKQYLFLREQDVAALSQQLSIAMDHAKKLEVELMKERSKHQEARHQLAEQAKQIGQFEETKAAIAAELQKNIDDLKFDAKTKADAAKVFEKQVVEAAEEMLRLKERVRMDIRKIRVREKELENRLEIMKRDSEALIGEREKRILELKRKLDLTEFNLDLLQDQYSKEREINAALKEKLTRALQAVRVAGGLLDGEPLKQAS
jgi:hypothetical protein